MKSAFTRILLLLPLSVGAHAFGQFNYGGNAFMLEPTTGVYYSYQAHLFPNGHMEPNRSPFSAIKQEASTLPGLFGFETPIKSPDGMGFLTQSRYFYQMQEDGSASRVDIYKNGWFTCDADPTISCFVYTIGEIGGNLAAVTFHSADGIVPRFWNGTTFVPGGQMPQDFSFRDISGDEAFNLLFNGITKVEPYGNNTYVKISGQAGSARDMVSVLVGRTETPLVIPLPIEDRDNEVAAYGHRRDGDELTILASIQQSSGQQKLALVRIYRDKGTFQAEFKSLSGLKGISDTSRFIGIDASKTVYGQKTSGYLDPIELWAFDLDSQASVKLGTFEVASPYADYFASDGTGLWVSQDNDLVRYQSGKVDQVIKVGALAASISISSQDGEAFSGVLSLRGLGFIRYDQGQKTVVKSAGKPVIDGDVAAPYWYDDQSQRVCGRSNYNTKCLGNGHWETTPFAGYTTIIRSRNKEFATYTDYTALEYHIDQRTRGASTWTRLDTIDVTGKFAAPILTSNPDEFAVKIGDTIMIYTPSGQEEVTMPSDVFMHSLTMSGDLLYGFCRIEKEGSPNLTKVCTLDKSGAVTILPYDIHPEDEADVGAMSPTPRGVIFKTRKNFSYDDTWVVYQDKAIKLSHLYGEAKFPERADIGYIINAEDQTINIAIEEEEFEGSTAVRTNTVYKFDGQSLTKIGSSSVTTGGAIISGGPSSSDGVDQIWQSQPGHWHTNNNIDSNDNQTAPMLTYPSAFSASAKVLLAAGQVTATAASANHITAADAYGLWRCPKSSSRPVTSQTKIVPWAIGCKHFGFVRQVESIAAVNDAEWLIQSGRHLYRVDFDTETLTALSDKAESPGFHHEAGQLTYGAAEQLITIDASQGKALKTQTLPQGVSADQLIRLSQDTVCTDSGYYLKQPTGWAKLLENCQGLVRNADGTNWVNDNGTLKSCDQTTCHEVAQLPAPQAKGHHLVAGTDASAPVVALGNKIYKLDPSDGTFYQCDIKFAHGPLPRTKISQKHADSGLLVLKKGGVMTAPCDSPSVLRL